jgi:hypothetical protein
MSSALAHLAIIDGYLQLALACLAGVNPEEQGKLLNRFRHGGRVAYFMGVARKFILENQNEY